MSRSSSGNNTIALAVLAAGLLVSLAILYNGGSFDAVTRVGKGAEITGRTATGQPAGETAAVPPASPAPAAAPTGGQVPLANEPAFGPVDAKVTVVEFVDFQCPFCKQFAEETFPQLKQTFLDTNRVRFVFKDLPLDFHPQAPLAAVAANCAHDQGKYLTMHDRIFAGQRDWSGKDEAKDIFIGYARALGLNLPTFLQCLDADKYKDEIAGDLQEAVSVGARGTPSFLINGELFVGAQPFANFQEKIEALLK